MIVHALGFGKFSRGCTCVSSYKVIKDLNTVRFAVIQCGLPKRASKNTNNQ